jgi:hypothetical protein
VDLAIEAGVAALIAVLVLAGAGGSLPRADVRAMVDARLPGRAIPAGFLGLSTEYTSVERYAGSDPNAINPVLVRLIKNLTPGQAPVLRIGGDSTDRSWWPVSGATMPPGVTYTLTPRWLELTRALQRALGARMILGINLEAASAAVAQGEAKALRDGLGTGAIRALELGNEPELYGIFAWYRTADHAKVTGRPRSYDFSSFAGDFNAVAQGLPNLPLAGPAFGGFSWTPHLAEFLSSAPSVALVTLHRYPLQHCFIKPDSPRYATIDHLLAPRSSVGLANSFAPYAAVAHARGRPLRVDEFNTVSCGAVRSVSQSFASALWAPDALFALARAGVDGVNLHTFPGAGYELFTFNRTSGRWSARVYPEYYGLLLFARAAPAGSRLLPAAASGPAAVRIWATSARDGSTRVLLVNDDRSRQHVAAVRVVGAGGAASLIRMLAPSAEATTGVTLGGASFGEQTTNGSLDPHADGIGAHGGRYFVTLPAASAALLTIAPGR